MKNRLGLDQELLRVSPLNLQFDAMWSVQNPPPRDQYLKGSVQLVHLSELVSFGEMQLCSHRQIPGVLLQGPVQSIQSLADTQSEH